MVVGVAEVPVVEQPHIPQLGDLVVFAGEELGEVLCGLHEVGEPDHGRQVLLLALQELASQAHLGGV